MDRLSEYVINHSSCYMPRCEYVENGIEIDCDKCQEIMIAEHDKQIRADAIDECTEVLRPIVSELRSALMENKNAFIDLDIIAQQLKEQKND